MVQSASVQSCAKTERSQVHTLSDVLGCLEWSSLWDKNTMLNFDTLKALFNILINILFSSMHFNRFLDQDKILCQVIRHFNCLN